MRLLFLCGATWDRVRSSSDSDVSACMTVTQRPWACVLVAEPKAPAPTWYTLRFFHAASGAANAGASSARRAAVRAIRTRRPWDSACGGGGGGGYYATADIVVRIRNTRCTTHSGLIRAPLRPLLTARAPRRCRRRPRPPPVPPPLRTPCAAPPPSGGKCPQAAWRRTSRRADTPP